VSSVLKKFIRKEGLTANENNVYRNFNLLIAFVLVDLTVIIFLLKDAEPVWPFWLCVVDFMIFIVLVALHIRGYMMFARYGTVLLTLGVQVVACIIHGKSEGFDYLFYCIGLLPMLFFQRPVHYASLFVISMATMLSVQYLYTITAPIISIGGYIYYWNIFFTGSLIFLVMYIFKSGYERTQEKLLDQHNMISQQKEEIEVINNNLEQIVVDRTERLKDHEQRITKFTFINEHRVRSPLARIMGLLNLIDLEKDKGQTLEDYLPLLRDNAEELNGMLKEVSDTLNEIHVEPKK
jgi:signal transduction histidine kinase